MSKKQTIDWKNPPRRRCRIQWPISSSSSEGSPDVVGSPAGARSPVVDSPASRGGGPSPDRGCQEQSSPRAASEDRPVASRVRGNERGGRRRGSRGSTREDEEFGVPTIDNQLLIQLVEASPSLWDHFDRHHADHHLTQRLWRDICSQIFETWGDLNAAAQEKYVKLVTTRWRSIRDRFRRD